MVAIRGVDMANLFSIFKWVSAEVSLILVYGKFAYCSRGGIVVEYPLEDGLFLSGVFARCFYPQSEVAYKERLTADIRGHDGIGTHARFRCRHLCEGWSPKFGNVGTAPPLGFPPRVKIEAKRNMRL